MECVGFPVGVSYSTVNLAISLLHSLRGITNVDISSYEANSPLVLLQPFSFRVPRASPTRAWAAMTYLEKKSGRQRENGHYLAITNYRIFVRGYIPETQVVFRKQGHYRLIIRIKETWNKSALSTKGTILNFNPLRMTSIQFLLIISPLPPPPETHIKVTRLKEMINN